MGTDVRRFEVCTESFGAESPPLDPAGICTFDTTSTVIVAPRLYAAVMLRVRAARRAAASRATRFHASDEPPVIPTTRYPSTCPVALTRNSMLPREISGMSDPRTTSASTAAAVPAAGRSIPMFLSRFPMASRTTCPPMSGSTSRGFGATVGAGAGAPDRGTSPGTFDTALPLSPGMPGTVSRPAASSGAVSSFVPAAWPAPKGGARPQRSATVEGAAPAGGWRGWAAADAARMVEDSRQRAQTVAEHSVQAGAGAPCRAARCR